MFNCDYCDKLSDALTPWVFWQDDKPGQPLNLCFDCYVELTEDGADLEFDGDDETNPWDITPRDYKDTDRHREQS